MERRRVLELSRLAGDAFIDILRGTHALYFSTAILENQYGDREIICKAVDDGSWTIEKMMTLMRSFGGVRTWVRMPWSASEKCCNLLRRGFKRGSGGFLI